MKKTIDIIHDLGNKLAILSGTINKLSSSCEGCPAKSETSQRYTERLVATNQIALDLFRELRDHVCMKSADHNHQPLKLMNRKNEFQKNIDMFKKAYDVDVSVTFNVSPDCAVYSQEDLAKRVTINIIENAKKHGHATKVDILYTEYEQEVIVSFADNGTGIDDQILQNLNRGSLAEYQESGHGNHMIRNLVHSAGGWLEYRSTRMGAEVLIHLKKVQQDKPQLSAIA